MNRNYTTTTAVPRETQPVSIEALARAMEAIDRLPKPNQWIVIDPHGRMYKGTVEQMTRLLVQEHPLMRTALDLTRKNDG